MNSIARYIDGFVIACQVRMERQAHKGSFLLLEGQTDISRFSLFVDKELCSIVNCHGKPNLIEAIEILYDEGFLGALGLADADFDRLLNELKQHEGLIFSEYHDFDLDFAGEEILERYLSHVCHAEKVSEHGSVADIHEKIMKSIYPASVAKLMNRTRQIKLRLSGISVGYCLSGFNFEFEKYVDEVFIRNPDKSAEKTEFKKKITSGCKVSHDLFQVTNGHDFHEALGAIIRSLMSNRRLEQTRGSEVGVHLRMLLTEELFRRRSLFELICEWERDNSPYVILDKRLHAA